MKKIVSIFSLVVVFTALTSLFPVHASGDRKARSIVFHGNLITADLQKASLGSVLKRFQDEKGIRFKGDASVLSSTITARFKDLPVEKALRRLLSSTSYLMTFDKKGKVKGVVVVEKGKAWSRPRGNDKAEPEPTVLNVGESPTVEEQEALRVLRDVEPPGPPVDRSAPLPEALTVTEGLSPGDVQTGESEEPGDLLTPVKTSEPPGGPVEISSEEREAQTVIKDTGPPGE